MRTVKTTSGATAVQVVWSSRRGSRQIEHLGSAHGEAQLEALKAAAQQRIAAGQLELGLSLGGPGPAGPLPITSSRMSHLVDALERAYRVLGFEGAASGDDVLRHLVLARIIGFREPGFSKERRLEPQITIGLLTGQDGFPLMVSAFEGNRAETKTMLPVIEKFIAVRSAAAWLARTSWAAVSQAQASWMTRGLGVDVTVNTTEMCPKSVHSVD